MLLLIFWGEEVIYLDCMLTDMLLLLTTSLVVYFNQIGCKHWSKSANWHFQQDFDAKMSKFLPYYQTLGYTKTQV